MPPAARRQRAVVDDEEEEQRPRQRQRREPSDSENEDLDADDEPQGNAAQSSDDQLIKKLVRYALACEFSRTPIRRDGIKDKVLGEQGRAFKRVFDGAQGILRNIFGMEMVELPVKDKLTKEEKRKAAKSQTKSNASNSFILVSLLPEVYKTPEILAPSRIISADDEAAYVAFYTLLVSLIRIHGGELSEAMLKRYLTRLNAETNTFTNTKTEDTLAKLQRQGYLVKSVDRQAQQHGEAETATTWHIGPRGKIEVDDETVAGLVREVWGPEGRDDQLETKLHASLQIKEQEPFADDEVESEARNTEDSRFSEAENGGPSRRSGRRRRMQEDEDDE